MNTNRESEVEVKEVRKKEKRREEKERSGNSLEVKRNFSVTSNKNFKLSKEKKRKEKKRKEKKRKEIK